MRTQKHITNSSGSLGPATPFEKLHGLGNDFVLVDFRSPRSPKSLPKHTVKAIGDRKRGVGFDQLLLLTNAPRKTIKLKIYNTDGSLAEMCGNGLRAAALHVWRVAPTPPTIGATLTFLTDAGPRTATLLGPLHSPRGVLISTQMGVPRVSSSPKKLLSDKSALPKNLLAPPLCVNVGNPHVVLFLRKPPTLEEATHYGALIERHKAFPLRTNVEFCYLYPQRSGESAPRVMTRVYERGVGITEACGTGAVAVAAAVQALGPEAPSAKLVHVQFPGGQVSVEWNGDAKSQACLTGVAHHSFSGRWLLT